MPDKLQLKFSNFQLYILSTTLCLGTFDQRHFLSTLQYISVHYAFIHALYHYINAHMYLV